MKSTKFLVDLASLEHFPTDFDPFFFDEIAERFVLGDSSFELSHLLNFIEENTHLKQPAILWSVLLSVLKKFENKQQAAELFTKEWRRWLGLASEHSCMRKLFFELVTQLVKEKLIDTEPVQEISVAAVSDVLAESTNIDFRRCLSVFLNGVLNHYDELDSTVAHPLMLGLCQTNQSMVVDAVSNAFTGSKYLQRMTDPEKLTIHECLKGMERPGLVYLKFAAQVYQTSPELIQSRLGEKFSSDKVPSLVAFEVLNLDDSNISREMLLKFIASHTKGTVDNLVECIEEYEETFPEDAERIRRDIIAAIPNPRNCSAQSLTKMFNHLRLTVGVTSKVFIQAFLSAKPRIQCEPDLLDAFLADSDDLASLLQDPIIQRTFHELTIDVIMTKHSFNWLHTDSAIGILDKIADYFHYDEDSTHARISSLVDENDDDLGYVSLTASKFLFRHAPEYVLKMVDDLFVLNPNTELRLIILNRLLLCSDAELPSKSALKRILNGVIQLESNEEIQGKGLQLAEKLLLNDSAYQPYVEELRKLAEIQEERYRRQKSYDMDELAQSIIQTAKISADCYTSEVSKECY